jgi:hypothetical protein
VTVDAAPTREDYVALENAIELLEESLLDAQLAADTDGWAQLGAGDTVITRDQLRRGSRLARIMAVADPLIRRAVNLRIAYVWGGGVTVQAKQEDDAEQDVNAVVQGFLDDESNQATFTSAQAREEYERRLCTGGNSFESFPTSPLTGRVQVRNIPADEIDDIITNPDDKVDRWFYQRTYTRVVVEAGYAGTRTRRETRTVFYPALGYSPKLRPSTIDGKPVEWDKPVLHTFVNRPEGSLWGVGDVHAALPWAQGYKEFLEDWARLVKALSRFAFRATAKNRPGAAKVRSAIATGSVDGSGQVGQTVITGEGQAFEAIGKSGATIDSNSGRPLAAMVAAGTDIPVTMLLADPGVTGARATAETLDKPLELIAGMRRDLHAAILRRILGYVIDQAVRAPQGPLKGTRTVDPVTGREVVRLANDQDRSVDIDWPDLSDTDIGTLVKAIVEADGTELMPELTTLRLLLIALQVDNVDEVLAKVTDDAGNFLPPRDATAARSQQDAVAGGDPVA